MKARKILLKVLSGSKNIRLDEFVFLLEAFGFVLKRTKGSHRTFKHPLVPELLSVQPSHNDQVKLYQLRQFLKMIEEYNLQLAEVTRESDEA